MPVVLRIDGLDVVIRFNDHRPAHVHIRGGGKEALFNLNCPDGPCALRENFGFSRAELNRIKAAIDKELSLLCAEWRTIHGNF
jgi:Domain of unknown function (DUF4160)